jgi:hypothetical protein
MTTGDREVFDAAFRAARRAPVVNGHNPNGGPSRIIMLDEMAIDREVFWLLDGMMPRGSMGMIYGRGGSGKTALATSLALGIASGTWFGREAELGGVVYAAFERPGDTQDRLAALRDRHRAKGLPLALLPLAGRALDEEAAQEITIAAQTVTARAKVASRLIVIDTVAAALGGARENDDGLGRLRMLGERMHAETGATILWLHHEGKADANGPRGHLTLADACVFWWHIDQREDGSRLVSVGKSNRGPSYAPLFAYRLLPFDAGADVRGKPITLTEVAMCEVADAIASRPFQRAGSRAEGRPGPDRLGTLQAALLGELVKLSRRHPEGVDQAALKSAFIVAAEQHRQNTGEAPVTAKSYSIKFLQTLNPMIRRERIERLENGLLLPGDRS